MDVAALRLLSPHISGELLTAKSTHAKWRCVLAGILAVAPQAVRTCGVMALGSASSVHELLNASGE